MGFCNFCKTKTYIEHITHNNLKEVDKYYDVKCAGMPKRCKDLFIKSLTQEYDTEQEKFTQEEIEFIKINEN